MRNTARPVFVNNNDGMTHVMDYTATLTAHHTVFERRRQMKSELGIVQMSDLRLTTMGPTRR